MADMQEIVVSGSWRDRVAELIGKRREMWVVAAVVAVTVIGSLLVWMHGAPASVAPPATAPAAPAPAAAAADATPAPGGDTQAAGSAPIYVHVAGAVRKPGLYELPTGTRVAGAIDAAGGPTRRADLDQVNLAEVLVDGTKLAVPERGDAVAAPMPAGTAAAPGLVNLNSADQASLETIPGVGPVTATAIIQHRTEIGSFTALEQLLDVTGIGPATLESLRPYVTL